VSKRLRTVEDRLARELDACASELELALQLPDQYISEASDSPNSTVAGRT
jgi:hypothetical protein